MLRSIVRQLRNVPVLGSVLQNVYAGYIIKDTIRSKRTTPVSDVFMSYEGSKLDENAEDEAQMTWIEYLEPELRRNDVPSYVRMGLEKRTIKKIKEAIREKAIEQKRQKELESIQDREMV